MKKLLNLFRPRKAPPEPTDPVYKLLARALSRSRHKLNPAKVYNLFGVADTQENREKLETAIKNKDFSDHSSWERYNTMGDNLDFFLVEDSQGQTFLIVMTDPFEVYAPEQILRTVLFSAEHIGCERKLIYQRDTH